MTFDHSAQAAKRIAWRYRNATKFGQWIDTLPAIGQTEIETTAVQIRDVLDLDNAVSWQLDIIGAIVGQGRTDQLLFDDENYRIAIRARIAKNNSDATIDGIREAVEFIISDTVFEVVDNLDMSFVITLENPLSDTVKDLILNVGIIPRPQGVKLTGFVNPEELPVFGFDGLGSESPLPFVEGFGELNTDVAFTLSDGSVLAIGSDSLLTVSTTDENIDGPGGHFAELYEVA